MMIVKRDATKCCFELFGYNGSRKFVLQKKLLQDQIEDGVAEIDDSGQHVRRFSL